MKHAQFAAVTVLTAGMTPSIAMAIGGDDPVESGTQFNPAISLILDTVYSSDFGGHPETPTGFGLGHSHDHGHDHDHAHGVEEGFQLRELEMAMTGTVDPYFDMSVLLSFSESSVEIEEAYITTRALPAGLQVKGGKFLSDIGYINRQHIHDWQFVDQPWVMEQLFGDHGLSELGVQLSWMPATESYTRLGIEVLEGDTSGISQQDGGHYDDHDVSVDLDERSSPRLVTAFGKWAPDLGHDHAAQFGVSAGYTNTWQQVDSHSSREDIWDGDAWFAGVDAVYKYDAGRSYGHGNWTVQAEYFYREQDFDWLATDGSHDDSGTNKQDGLYAQAVYGFAPRWNTGLRIDALGLRNTAFDPGRDEDGNRVRDFVDFDTSYRYTAQVSYLPTEFSRFRFQVSQESYGDNPNVDHDHEDAWRAMFQANIALGVHGAHSF